MDIFKEFEELETGIRFQDKGKIVHVAINTTQLHHFLSGDFHHSFLYVAVDNKDGSIGEFETISLDQTVIMRDYLTKILEMKGLK
jgi:hypothetical protein